MKITYSAQPDEMTDLAHLLTSRHRGRIHLHFHEEGVVAEIEIGGSCSIQGAVSRAVETHPARERSALSA